MTFYLLNDDTRKKEFIALRLERDLFQKIKEKAGDNVSGFIREVCKEAVNG